MKLAQRRRRRAARANMASMLDNGRAAFRRMGCTRLGIWAAVLEQSPSVQAAVLEELGPGWCRVRIAPWDRADPDEARLEAEEALFWHTPLGVRFDLEVDARVEPRDMVRMERARSRRYAVDAGRARRVGVVTRALWAALFEW